MKNKSKSRFLQQDDDALLDLEEKEEEADALGSESDADYDGDTEK